jgi:lipopolysaccharide-induced tumor necrosis factor-alpha factor
MGSKNTEGDKVSGQAPERVPASTETTGEKAKAEDRAGLPPKYPEASLPRYDTMTSFDQAYHYPSQSGHAPTAQPNVFVPAHLQPVPLHILTTTVPQPTPFVVSCPHCHRVVTTEASSVPGLLTYVCCFGILALGGWLGCCLVPFLADSLRDIEHHCPACRRVIARYQRL